MMMLLATLSAAMKPPNGTTCTGICTGPKNVSDPHDISTGVTLPTRDRPARLSPAPVTNTGAPGSIQPAARRGDIDAWTAPHPGSAIAPARPAPCRYAALA